MTRRDRTEKKKVMKCKLKSDVRRKEGSGERGAGGGKGGNRGLPAWGRTPLIPMGLEPKSPRRCCFSGTCPPTLGTALLGGVRGPWCSCCRDVGAAPLSPKHPVAPYALLSPKRGTPTGQEGQSGDGKGRGSSGGAGQASGRAGEGGDEGEDEGVGGGVRCWCRAGGAQREVMSLSALSSSSLMALYFIFCAYTSSAGSGEGAAGGWRAVERGGGEWQRERERG